MTIPEQIDGELVTMLALEALGAPESSDGLASDAAIASALRRAVSFDAPIARQRLIGSVDTAVGPFIADRENLKARVGDVLDRLVAHGDLLEVEKTELGTRRHVLLRPPAFVIAGDVCFVLGVRPDGAPILADGNASINLMHDGPIRRIRSRHDGIREFLIDAGLQEIQIEQWIEAPAEISGDELIGSFQTLLAEASESGRIEGIEILDPESPRGFYRGRFRAPTDGEVGFFVSRRPQQFGPSRWCIAEFEHGQTRKVIDLPLMGGLGRPTDEAWRLQAAIDRAAGHPQFARISDRADGEASLSFFGPLPSWARKRLDLLGAAVEGSRGALFAYRLDDAALAAECEFLSSRLWLRIEDVH